jgi:para-nitrobenzyl esterase
LPVIVWIYGGGFNVGSASMANYAGANLARKGAVYIAISYRVGPFGFLAHPELSTEAGGHSGNYGLQDQVAALQWVQRNAAAFGGDPGNVTIMGQSAGSMSVSLLQIDPLAKGLFHKLVGMSGSAHTEMMGPIPLVQGEAQGRALQAALGASSIEAMRDMAGDRVMAVAAGVPRSPIVIDGAHITGSPAEVFAARRHSDVPLMLGFTRDERFVNLGPASTVAEYRDVVRAAFGARADAVLKSYPAASDAEVQRAQVDLMRDMSLGRQMYNWALASQTSGKAPAYAYFFTRRQPYVPGIAFSDHDPATAGAYHTGEVPYFLRNLDSLNLFRQTRDWTAEDRALRDTMSEMILNFARLGHPAANWPAFDPHRPQVMQLGLEVKLLEWPNYRTLALLADARLAPPPARLRD